MYAASLADVTPDLLAAARTGLNGVRPGPLWGAGPPRGALRSDLDVDLAVVGGGLTGLWTALLAAQASPGRSIAVVEAGTVGWAASGRNGGFCSSSLTHGLANGLARWPADLPALLRMGAENLDEIEATVAEFAIDCDFRRSGELSVAVAPWQLEELTSLASSARPLGLDVEPLSAAATRSLVDSPMYLGGLLDRRGTALVDPGALVQGLAAAAASLGVQVVEGARVTGLQDLGGRVRLPVAVPGAAPRAVRARQVVLATNAFPSPLRTVRPFVVPVWDHVLATAPLSPAQRASVGWSGREGVADAGNQFHYYRLTRDDRIVWGGYDALYYYGSDLSQRRMRRRSTELLLAVHLYQTFPQLAGLPITHAWAGAVDTTTRFTAFWRRALAGKVIAVQGFTGLGVGASRFGAAVALDLLAGATTARTSLEMVRRGPVPFPPEPARWAGITLTRHGLARADAHGGRRNLWLRTLDRLGLGFDS